MRPTRKTDAELLEWARSILAREQDRHTFGLVSFHLEAGRVVRVKIETSERPED